MTERATMETFSMVELTFHNTNIRAYTHLVRHFVALKKAISTLCTYYGELDASSGNRPSHHSNRYAPGSLHSSEATQIYPYPTIFKHSANSEQLSFVYVERMMTNRPFLFRAHMQNSRKICVKFVQRYVGDVHARCADEGFAPGLLAFERLPGGWNMVIMDHLDEKSWTALSLASKEIRTLGLKDAMARALKKLSEWDMVHGDLRDSNVMVNKDDPLSFMLVDFDWAGVSGQVE